MLYFSGKKLLFIKEYYIGWLISSFTDFKKNWNNSAGKWRMLKFFCPVYNSQALDDETIIILLALQMTTQGDDVVHDDPLFGARGCSI